MKTHNASAAIRLPKRTRTAQCLWESWPADPRFERCTLHGEVRRRPTAPAGGDRQGGDAA
jgi:hypothetical protein